MKKSLVGLSMLFFMLTTSVALADKVVESSDTTKSDMLTSETSEVKDSSTNIDLSEVTEFKVDLESGVNNASTKRANKPLKGTEVPNVPGLKYLENIYPVGNLYDRFTLDFDYSGYSEKTERTPADGDNFNPYIRYAPRFFNQPSYRFQWATPTGGEYYYKTYESSNMYPGELKEGFNTVKIKVRKVLLADPWSQIVEVPVFLSTPYFQILNEVGNQEPKYAVKIVKNGKKKETFPYYSAKDIRRQSVDTINEMLEEDLSFELYDVITHERIPESEIPVTFAGSSIEDYNARGQRDIKINIGSKPYTIKDSLLIVSDELINDYGDLEEYEPVNYNDSKGMIINPVNKTKVAMPNRGIKGRADQVDGYLLRDENDYGMGFERGWRGSNVTAAPEIRSRTQPSINFGIREVGDRTGRSLYPPTSGGGEWERGNAFSGILQSAVYPERPNHLRPLVDQYTPTKYFLKKGTRQLLQIHVDETNKVTYAFSNDLERNLNFSARNSMYNNENKTKEFAAAEFLDTDYYGDNVPIITLGGHQGFKLSTGKGIPQAKYENMELSIRIKNANGEPLSDISKYKVGAVGGHTFAGAVLNNPFGKHMEGDGIETMPELEKANQKLVDGEDSAYSLGTRWKRVRFDEGITSGTEMFLGTEIKYMSIDLNPDNKHIYQDQYKEADQFYTDYTISQLQGYVKKGNMEITYPDGFIDKQYGETKNGVDIKGRYIFDRSHFPKELNPNSGKEVIYPVKMMFINDSNDEYDELPSYEGFYNIHVYNLGATGILQQMKTLDPFEKKASEVITNPAFVPGHKIKYEYIGKDGKVYKEDEKPTVEELGVLRHEDNLQFAKVKMTDVEPGENNRSAIVEVPFLFTEDIQTGGLMIAANDFKTEPIDMRSWTPANVEKFLVDNSSARGWNLDEDPPKLIPAYVDVDAIATDDLNLKSGDVVKFTFYVEHPDDFNIRREKTIEVTVAPKLEADIVNQTIPVGKKLTDDDLKKFVTNVKGADGKLNANEYDVHLLKEIPDVVTNADVDIPIEVTFAGEAKGTGIELNVPTKIVWGNSISFGGDEKDGRMGGGTYSLHNNGTSGEAYISAVSGAVKTGDNGVITTDSNFSGKYLELDYFSLEGSSDPYIIKEGAETPTNGIKAFGNDEKQYVLNKWGNKPVRHGDIIRGWSAEADKQYLSTGDTPKALNDKEKEIYYEVTKDGYRRLQFNRIESVEKYTVPYKTSNSELDKLLPSPASARVQA